MPHDHEKWRRMRNLRTLTMYTLTALACLVVALAIAPAIRRAVVDNADYIILAFSVLLLAEPITVLSRAWNGLADRQRALEVAKVFALVAIPVITFSSSARDRTRLVDALNAGLDAQRQAWHATQKVTKLEHDMTIGKQRLAAAELNALHAQDEAIRASRLETGLATQLAAQSRRVALAEQTASAAAAKAGLIRIDHVILAKITETLRGSGIGAAQVACNSGLELACEDLRTAFKRAGWTVDILKGAPFLAGSDPNDHHGIYVFSNPKRASAAKEITELLNKRSLDAVIRISSLQVSPFDIRLNWIYVSPLK